MQAEGDNKSILVALQSFPGNLEGVRSYGRASTEGLCAKGMMRVRTKPQGVLSKVPLCRVLFVQRCLGVNTSVQRCVHTHTSTRAHTHACTHTRTRTHTLTLR